MPKQKSLPLCRYEQSPSAIILGSSETNVFFRGTVGRYVFVSDADSISGAASFSIYDVLSGKRIYQDYAEGDFDTTAIDTNVLRLRYRRAYNADCSMVAQAEQCWAAIRKTTLLPPEPKPNCLNSYRVAKENAARNHCLQSSNPRCIQEEIRSLSAMDKSPSFISFPVEISNLNETALKPHPTAGPLNCWPAE